MVVTYSIQDIQSFIFLYFWNLVQKNQGSTVLKKMDTDTEEYKKGKSTESWRTEIENKQFEFESEERGWGQDLGNLELLRTETSRKYF